MSSVVRSDAPGAAVMVIRDGKIVHQKGYGLANVEAKTPIDEHTMFDLASVSKQFTAMAIMILAERGKLSYDDPLTKFFPELLAYAAKITVRHLLNHTSGLPDYMGEYQKVGNPDFEPTAREVIGILARIDEPLFAPGEKWQYSNSGYVVLAQVAEKASGVAFPAFVKTNIFDPLGMSSSLVADAAESCLRRRERQHVDRGHVQVGPGPLYRQAGHSIDNGKSVHARNSERRLAHDLRLRLDHRRFERASDGHARRSLGGIQNVHCPNPERAVHGDCAQQPREPQPRRRRPANRSSLSRRQDAIAR